MKGEQMIRCKERKQAELSCKIYGELAPKLEIESIFALEISTGVSMFFGLIRQGMGPLRVLEV